MSKKLSTSDLNKRLSVMDTSENAFAEYTAEMGSMDHHTLHEYLTEQMKLTGLDTASVIRLTNLNRNYANQIFNGRRAHPDKYKLISICIVLGMSVKETDRALYLANQPKLYAKDPYDAALIVCLHNKLSNIMKVNDYLDRIGLAPLNVSE